VGAAVVIKGDVQSLEVEAKDATIDEVLEALSAKWSLHYRMPAGLNRRMNRTCRGSLARVVSQMLRGYNFVVGSFDDGQLEVLVLGTAGASGAHTAAAPTAEASPTVPLAPLPKAKEPPTPTDAARVFGSNAPPVQVPEAFIQAYAKRAMRGNSPNRFRRDF
jgi:hypothetical protein